MDEVKGYKAFNKDLTNRYGKPFTEGETYSTLGKLQFGNDGNGYHMCTSLCDVFRYVNATEDDVIVAQVTGRGERIRRDDDYNGYYDMYCFRELTVDRFLSREEVIEMMLNASSLEVKKFLITCRLSEEEKVMFARKFRNDLDVIKHLLYYHFDCKTVFSNYSYKDEERIRLVLEYGQDNNKGSKGE